MTTGHGPGPAEPPAGPAKPIGPAPQGTGPAALILFVASSVAAVILSAHIARGGALLSVRWRLLAEMAVWAAAWVVAVAAAFRLPRRRAMALLFLVALALRAAALTGPPTTTDDFYRYSWDGRVQAAGLDPYEFPPSSPRLEGLREPWLWPQERPCPLAYRPDGCTRINRSGVPTIYPPVAEGWFATIYRLTGIEARHKPWQVAGLVTDIGVVALLCAGSAPPGPGPPLVRALRSLPGPGARDREQRPRRRPRHPPRRRRRRHRLATHPRHPRSGRRPGESRRRDRRRTVAAPATGTVGRSPSRGRHPGEALSGAAHPGAGGGITRPAVPVTAPDRRRGRGGGGRRIPPPCGPGRHQGRRLPARLFARGGLRRRRPVPGGRRPADPRRSGRHRLRSGRHSGDGLGLDPPAGRPHRRRPAHGDVAAGGIARPAVVRRHPPRPRHAGHRTGVGGSGGRRLPVLLRRDPVASPTGRDRPTRLRARRHPCRRCVVAPPWRASARTTKRR